MRKSILKISLAAMMIALSIVIATFAKGIFGSGPLRVTFENIPIMLAGMLLGPVWGAVVGAAADLVACMFSGMSPLPLVTVGAACIGAISGILYKYIIKRKGFFATALSVFPAHIVGSMIVKTYALSAFYPFKLIIWRVPIYIGIALVETFALNLLLKNKYITDTFGGKKEEQ